MRFVLLFLVCIVIASGCMQIEGPGSNTETCTMTGGVMYGFVKVESNDINQSAVAYEALSEKQKDLFKRLRNGFVKDRNMTTNMPQVIAWNDSFYMLEQGYYDRFC